MRTTPSSTTPSEHPPSRWAPFREALDRCLDLSRQDPESAKTKLRGIVAQLAATMPAPGEKARWVDLQAEAWALLANAHRAKGDLDRAHRTWPRARKLAEHGSGDIRLRAFLTELEAALWKTQRDFPTAFALLRLAEQHYGSLGDRPRLGRVQLQVAEVHFQAGDNVAAFEAILAAFHARAWETRPGLAIVMMHNLALCFEALGKHAAGAGLLRRIRRLYAATGDEPFRLRGLWLEGRLERAAGRPDRAIACLEQVRQGFLEREMAYDAALASLDLSLVYSQIGAHWHMAQMAREMFPVFATLQIPREAYGALMLFADAARHQRASLTLVNNALSQLDPKARIPAVEAT